MKYIKYSTYSAILFSLLCLNSCKKALQETPYSSLSSSAVFNNEAGLQKATLGIYDTFVNAPFTTAYRFNLAEQGQQYSDLGQFGDLLSEVSQYTFTPSSGTEGPLDNIWVQDYQAISRANTVIANATTAVPDTAVANKYIAEAKCLRAFAYFDLVRNFGGVPIEDQQISSLSQTNLIYGSRATTQATYDFIVSDLQTAASDLPPLWTGTNVGRVNAGTALALLGKVYLTMAGKPLQAAGYYQKAIAVLNEVVGSANEAKYGFALQANYADIFSNANKRNSEILIDFSEFYSSSHSTAALFPFFFLPCGIYQGNEQTNIGVTYAYYQLFPSGDARRDETLIYRYKNNSGADNAPAGDSIIYNPVRLKYIDTNTHVVFANNTINQGISFGKCDRMTQAANNPFSCQTDFVPFRFADAILCLAEAEVETGDVNDALVLINRIRTRAHAPLITSTTNMEATVRLERRLELGGEFNTIYDIRRWGTLQSEIAAMKPFQVVGGVVGTYNAKFELFPIPQNEIDANSKLTQNPGY